MVFSKHRGLCKIYDEVTKRLTSQKEDITNLIASSGESEQQQSQTGDTVNVWRKQKLYKLTQSKATNKFFFTIYPDSNYKEKDIICGASGVHLFRQNNILRMLLCH